MAARERQKKPEGIFFDIKGPAETAILWHLKEAGFNKVEAKIVLRGVAGRIAARKKKELAAQ